MCAVLVDACELERLDKAEVVKAFVESVRAADAERFWDAFTRLDWVDGWREAFMAIARLPKPPLEFCERALAVWRHEGNAWRIRS